jgi:hypothetical protein
MELTNEEIDKKIQFIKDNKAIVVSERVTELDKWIKILPDRQPTKEGNTTMKQYLQRLKLEVKQDPERYIESEIKRLEEIKLIKNPEPVEMEKI